MKPALVIFDCDGVLVDSEPLAVQALCAAIRAAGGEMSEGEAYARFLGRSLRATAEELRAEGVDLTPPLLAQMRARLHARFEAELQPIRGVLAAADALAASGAALCVASSSQPERVALALRATGLLDRFAPNLYSATMVERGKPAPDLFLHAAHAMGAAPEACVVVEDSPAGLQAAAAAGMAGFAYVGGGHAAAGGLRAKAEALAPAAVFDDMAALPGLIAAHAPGGAE